MEAQAEAAAVPAGSAVFRLSAADLAFRLSVEVQVSIRSAADLASHLSAEVQVSALSVEVLALVDSAPWAAAVNKQSWHHRSPWTRADGSLFLFLCVGLGKLSSLGGGASKLGGLSSLGGGASKLPSFGGIGR